MHADWAIPPEISAAAAAGRATVAQSAEFAEAVFTALGLENVTEAELEGQVNRAEGAVDAIVSRPFPLVIPASGNLLHALSVDVLWCQVWLEQHRWRWSDA